MAQPLLIFLQPLTVKAPKTFGAIVRILPENRNGSFYPLRRSHTWICFKNDCARWFTIIFSIPFSDKPQTIIDDYVTPPLYHTVLYPHRKCVDRVPPSYRCFGVGKKTTSSPSHPFTSKQLGFNDLGWSSSPAMVFIHPSWWLIPVGYDW